MEVSLKQWKKKWAFAQDLKMANKPGYDQEGYPIFYTKKDPCSRCAKPLNGFDSPYCEVTHQMLGYCQKCQNQVMGKLPAKSRKNGLQVMLQDLESAACRM